MARVPIEHLDDAELTERMHKLALNLYFDNGKLSLPACVKGAFEETVAECNRRKLDRVLTVPECIHESDHAPIVQSGVLIRYSKRVYLEALMQGFVSFGPSRQYKNASVDAQKDDEMRRGERCPNQVLNIGGVEYPASRLILYSDIADVDGALIDYHLLCMSVQEVPKLRRAFHAEGFVRIRDSHQFLTLVSDALRKTYPEATLMAGEVRYYDDREGHGTKTLKDRIFCKTVEYMYQREFRIAIIGAPVPGEWISLQISPPEGLFELQLL